MWNALPGVTFGDFFLNSLKIATLATIGALLSCSMAAFAFAVLPFRGKGLLFALIMATLIIPFQVVLVPNFILYRALPHPLSDSGNWIGTQEPLWVGAWLGGAFGIFLIRQFFLTVPRELADAARVDGASPWGIFRWIYMPLARPVLATLAIFTFMWSWNDLLSPLIYLRDLPDYTTTVGLAFFQGQHVGQVAGDDGRRHGQPRADGGALRHRPAVLRARHRHQRAQGMSAPRTDRGVSQMLDMAGVPLYRQIQADLRERITSGQLSPGSRLETEQELMARYEVSRATVRQALAGLVNDGLVEIRRGLGTYVRKRRRGAPPGRLLQLQPRDRAARHAARHAGPQPARRGGRPARGGRPGDRAGRRRGGAQPHPAGRRRGHRDRDELPAGRPLRGARGPRLRPPQPVRDAHLGVRRAPGAGARDPSSPCS